MYITQPRSLIVHDTSAIDCYFGDWVISYAAGFVRRRRPISTEAQIGLSYAVEKGLFRLNFFRLRIRLADPVEKLDFFDWILQSKNSVEKLLHMYSKMIASPIPPPNTHTATRPHTHTRYHTAVSYKALTLAWLSLPLIFAASQRGVFLVPLASSVYHTTAAARGLDPTLPTTAAPAVALAAFS